MSRRGLTFLVASTLTLVLAVLAYWLPVPYVVLVPGPVTDTLGTLSDGKPVISVSKAQEYDDGGHIYLTTVGIVPGDCDEHPTLFQTLRAWLDDTKAVAPHQVICPPDEDSDQVQQDNEQDMSQSQRDAITAALLELGYEPSHEDVIVHDVTGGAPADGKLSQGDVLVAVNGDAVTTPDQLRTLIGAHPVGSTLRITVTRDGERREVTLKSTASADSSHRPVIGITPDVQATFTKPRVEIGIDPSQVGGPSAGLAFTLGIIDRLTPGSLTGGRTVASTGTITGMGEVGPIGGIQQKIAAAVDARASVFLVPAGDCADAKKVAPDSLALVRVETLDGALDALKSLASGGHSFPRC